MSHSDVAITARGLSKAYTIRTARTATLAEAMLHGAAAVFDRRSEVIWALRDVSLEVRHGEVLGVLGPNGAGKTTLLKILSRITWPTEGEAEVRGRVGSLLEVGAGFHTELTGRENVFLSGAVLGMTCDEVRRRFDEIVAFADVERFLDTPVKRYSVGMFMRLAFSVAAHLEPDILIVDEVLAVGDAAFQTKSLGQMERLAKSGRTVLLVSHNLAAIRQLCTRALLLEQGRAASEGPPEQVIERYLAGAFGSGGERLWHGDDAPGTSRVRIRAVRVVSGGQARQNIGIDEEIAIQIDYDNLIQGSLLFAGLVLLDSLGTVVFEAANLPGASLRPDPACGSPLDPGRYRSECRIAANLLNAGRYFVTVRVANLLPRMREAEVLRAISFTVVETGASEPCPYGVIRPILDWTTTRIAV